MSFEQLSLKLQKPWMEPWLRTIPGCLQTHHFSDAVYKPLLVNRFTIFSKYICYYMIRCDNSGPEVIFFSFLWMLSFLWLEQSSVWASWKHTRLAFIIASSPSDPIAWIALKFGFILKRELKKHTKLFVPFSVCINVGPISYGCLPLCRPCACTILKFWKQVLVT